MALSPPLRKLALTAHVISSVGWLGAVAAFVAISLAGLVGRDFQRAGAAYLAMELITWAVIVPLSLASLVTGVLSALGTPWGLFRHHWVVAKLLLNVVATLLLLLHTGPVGLVARAATQGVLSEDLRGVRIDLLADAVAGLVALLAATALGIYKPAGLTRHGWRKQHG
jgi:hypothetical protein